jgi:tetratricopeptide (TPR) repeat protein
MKSHLTSQEHLSFKRIDNVLELRMDSSALILLGSNSFNLSKEIENYFLEKEYIQKYTPQSKNILHELTTSLGDYYIINLYENHDISIIIKNLQFYRDNIIEFNLKLIFIFDYKSLEELKEEAFDFFSTNSYSYQFTDHSHKYHRSEISTNNKLKEKILKYKNYTTLNTKQEPKILIQMIFEIASEYYSISKLEKSLEYYEKAIDICSKNNLKYEYSVISGNVGTIYQDKGDLDSALKYQKEALEIHKEIGYTQGVANSLGNVGLIYQNKGDLDSALKYYKEALEIDKEIGYTQGVASNLGNIGIIYQNKGDLDSALKYQKEALEIHKEIGYTQGVASTLGNIGLIYQNKGDLDSALQSLNNSLDIFDKIKDTKSYEKIQSYIKKIQKEDK